MYTKAIAALITSLIGIATAFNVPVDLGWITQTLIGAVAVILNVFFVWRLPNKSS